MFPYIKPQAIYISTGNLLCPNLKLPDEYTSKKVVFNEDSHGEEGGGERRRRRR